MYNIKQHFSLTSISLILQISIKNIIIVNSGARELTLSRCSFKKYIYLRKNGYSLESGLIIFDKASIMNLKTTLVLPSLQINSPK